MAGLAWLVTFAIVLRTEVFGDAGSEDVRALVDAAGLGEAHASARYEVRLGNLRVGELVSTVSGGQRDDQLAYVLSGRLDRPQPVRLQGFVLSDWERRPERFVFEVVVAGQRHRVEGGLRSLPGSGVTFHARYEPPARADERTHDVLLPGSPVLAPGPLPIPELGPFDGDERGGSVAPPGGGAPVDWHVETHAVPAVEVAGESREAVLHVLRIGGAGLGDAGLGMFGDLELQLLTEPGGFPLRLTLPFGLQLVLVEERR